MLVTWRQSTQDGTYSPLAKEVRPGPALLFSSSNKRIGTLLNLESTFVITKNFSFGVDDGYFIEGNYPKGNGKGKDIFYVYTTELNGLTYSTRYYSVFMDRVRVLRGEVKKAA